MAKKQETQTETQAPIESGAPNFIRKLSAKQVMGDIRDTVAEMRVAKETGTRALYSLIGMAHGVRSGESDNGPFCALLGSFEATNYSTGEVFQSGQCFVPRAVEDVMIASLRAGQKEDKGASIQFGIEVGVKLSDTPIGYEYTVRNLVKTTNADPLASLRAAMPAPPAPKALPSKA